LAHSLTLPIARRTGIPAMQLGIISQMATATKCLEIIRVIVGCVVVQMRHREGEPLGFFDVSAQPGSIHNVITGLVEPIALVVC
jgi:hypothetical protein